MKKAKATSIKFGALHTSKERQEQLNAKILELALENFDSMVWVQEVTGHALEVDVGVYLPQLLLTDEDMKFQKKILGHDIYDEPAQVQLKTETHELWLSFKSDEILCTVQFYLPKDFTLNFCDFTLQISVDGERREDIDWYVSEEDDKDSFTSLLVENFVLLKLLKESL
ncbi:MAG: hypothetical protein COB67_01115 [SAR324 cluster bacterium]|uniref:Uncharacterized protein n=1 Tax=SAR324 cluster bacterium TaxID=2024889 RepID=A0A2A4TB79_9DELT|nr:MAG: hypothetical protein COB67_01115 [SAR324 cluster bacterium]